jgi:thioredoxin 1
LERLGLILGVKELSYPSDEVIMSDPVISSSDSTFASDVLNSDIPVLVDFWATWCGPCKAIAPHLEALAKEYDGKVKVVKIEADKHKQTANKYGVTALPTLILFKKGEAVKKQVGALNLAKLKQLVD